ncbi:autotransporter outer membrane beta-barrel domain-containing protein [Photobacterium japonica]|uniref:autotransporter domain-containing protein n=1 Tax=Photobacterium japonica TaxID=2910235 RepID=UPI003D0CA55A
MSLSLKQVTTVTSVVCLMASLPVAHAGDAAESTLSGRLSAEMDAAVSELKGIASHVRGDKIDRKVRAKMGRYSTAGLRGKAIKERTSIKRTVRQPGYLPGALPVQNAVSTQAGGAGVTHSNVLGGYMRVDTTTLKDNANQAGNEQEYSGYSLTLGGDYLFREHYLFGLTLGLPFYQSFNATNDTEIDGLVASGYFSYFRDAWYIDFTASYAVMDTDIERQVTLYTDSVINNANEADSDIWVFSVGTGYVFKYDYLNVALESSVQHTLSDTDRYSERLSMTNSNYLISKIDNVDALESTMLISGVSVSHPLRTPFGMFQPYAKGYVHYDIASGNERVISQLKSNHSGSILPIVVDSDDNFYGRMHLGISGAFNQDWYGYAEASSLIGHDDLSAYTLSVGVSIALD